MKGLIIMMPRFNKEVLCKYLKTKLDKNEDELFETNNNNPDCKIKSKEMKPFYYRDDERKNNFFYDLKACEDVKNYGGGAGQELEWKIRAIHSSSAMTYNIFSNNPFDKEKHRKVDIKEGKLPKGKYDLEYEKKLPALSNGSKANLDAFLKSDNNLIFFEMKMTEWLTGSPGKLSETYVSEIENGHTEKIPKEIAELFKKYYSVDKYSKEEKNGSSRKYYYPITNYFDVFQIIKHILGIYNGFKNDLDITDGKYKKVVLVIGYWTIPSDLMVGEKKLHDIYDKDLGVDFVNRLKKQIGKYVGKNGIKCEMEKEIREFCDSLKNVKELFFKEKEIDFSVIPMTVEDIVTCLDDKDKAKRNYLQKRYL
ncbi:hypothetical protein [Selenomonas ruminantium]|uniref:hypothetical protein n=1 Tax=Selenomonas ruminantium TaxID=971 RepID=UPI0026F0FD25|nr:hypothetical protein [Selenomonas ruminantium]